MEMGIFRAYEFRDTYSREFTFNPHVRETCTYVGMLKPMKDEEGSFMILLVCSAFSCAADPVVCSFVSRFVQISAAHQCM